jgi:predicted NAD-dependent protein-ADP-ribosyltransferase YbiA (DUF1768 family)
VIGCVLSCTNFLAEYGYFSNFSAHPVTIDGKEYATTEHYFQGSLYFEPNLHIILAKLTTLCNLKNDIAMKFKGTEHEEAIRVSHSPADAKKLGTLQPSIL